MDSKISFRFAKKEDTGLILDFIKKLAEYEKLLDEVRITCNKNTIPFDPQSPFVTSGIRLGTPAVTTRGMKEEDMFCSSVAGLGIPIKQNIYDYLRELLKRDDIYVMFMLSDNYYQSPACLNEMGAAWVTRHDCITFLLPGFEYKDIAGAVDPRELSIKLDDDELLIKSRLGEFKDDLMR